MCSHFAVVACFSSPAQIIFVSRLLPVKYLTVLCYRHLFRSCSTNMKVIYFVYVSSRRSKYAAQTRDRKEYFHLATQPLQRIRANYFNSFPVFLHMAASNTTDVQSICSESRIHVANCKHTDDMVAFIAIAHQPDTHEHSHMNRH